MIRRRFATWLSLLLVTLIGSVGLTVPAHAASADTIDNFNAVYTVGNDGSVTVDQTYVYRFGSESKRHGMYIYVITREPFTRQGAAGDQDRTYSVSDISVSSPDPDVSTQYTTSIADTPGEAKGRGQQEEIRIGSADRTVDAPTATYHVKYTVSRAIMNNEHGDEFYWDVITPAFPAIATATVTVNTPTEVVSSNCEVGKAKSKDQSRCGKSGSGTQQVFKATSIGANEGLSLSDTFESGAVSPNTPSLVEAGDKQERAAFQRNVMLSGGGTLLTTLLSIVGGLFLARSRRDERFQGVSPGLLPAPGQETSVGPDNRPEIPVQFNPPPISVGEAGMLEDSVVDVRDTTATLVDLAVRGYVELAMPEEGETLVRVKSAQAPTLAHEQVLMQSLFGNQPQPGQEIQLGERGEMTEVHADVSRAISQELTDRGFYKHVPRNLPGVRNVGGGIWRMVSGSIWVIAIVGFSASAAILRSAVMFLPVVPLIILGVWWYSRLGKGQRSGTGRAVTDQIEGFRKYIATAEADQLRFEEGQDIFSRYLPWAIMYGLTERWTKVCQQLVAMGRIPDTAPTWYYGPWYGYGNFYPMWIDDSVGDSFSPAPSASSSGSGSGDSGFGGGSVGGGGGGGGVGSW